MRISTSESIKFLMSSPINNHLGIYWLIDIMNTFGKMGLTLAFKFETY